MQDKGFNLDQNAEKHRNTQKNKEEKKKKTPPTEFRCLFSRRVDTHTLMPLVM